MGLEEVLKNINELVPYWGIYASSGAVIVGYVLGRIHAAANADRKRLYRQDETYQKPKGEIKTYSEPESEAETEDEEDDEGEGYEKQTIKDALVPDIDARISGVIVEFHNSLRGYSGIIKDETGQALFYIDEDNMNSVEYEGLVPLLLENSKRTETSIEMDGSYNEETNIFRVIWLRHKMNDQKYQV